MADIATTQHNAPTDTALSKTRLVQIMLVAVVVLIAARPVLPDFLVRLPDAWIHLFFDYWFANNFILSITIPGLSPRSTLTLPSAETLPDASSWNFAGTRDGGARRDKICHQH